MRLAAGLLPEPLGSYGAPVINGMGRGGRVREREGAEGKRVGKGEGGIDFDICPGPPSS